MVDKSGEKKKILLIRHRDFSFTDLSIYQQLLMWFPDYEIVVFNVYDLYKKITVFQLFINLFYFIWEYGVDFLTGVKKFRNIFTFFKSTSYFVNIFRKHTVKAIYEGNYYFVFQLQSLFNGVARGVPHFVYSDHITLANYHYPNINPRQYARSSRFVKIERALYQQSLRCFTMSSNISELIVKEYKVQESKVKCVYAGNNVKIDFNAKKHTYAQKTILFVGVDWKRKGGPVLLKAFEKVLMEVPDARLITIGCKPDTYDVKNVSVKGKLKLEELPEYFSNATVFCMPTMREPFGLVFVEAMVYRLPIVANNIGALPDMVKNGVNGYLIDNDVSEYAKALIKLLKDQDLCKQLGENGYNIAMENYIWDKVGQKLHMYINEAME